MLDRFAIINLQLLLTGRCCFWARHMWVCWSVRLLNGSIYFRGVFNSLPVKWPDCWDGPMLDRSAVGQLSSYPVEQNGRRYSM